MVTSEKDLLKILHSYWGFDSFREPQLFIIESVLANKDTLAILPTGGGKSLCYQLPAVMFSELTIVISPLIALMNDQVSSLKSKGIPADSINSSNSFSHNRNIYNNIHLKKVKVLFISPEKFCSDGFQTFVKDIKIALLVIDEAHCISQWGHDFRPQYLKIGEFSKTLNASILALTATANAKCKNDIIEFLNLKKPSFFNSTLLRANISFSNYFTSSKRKTLLELCQKIKGSKIVYVRSRRMTHELSDFLIGQGIKSHSYNAGMTNAKRAKSQSLWNQNKIDVIVATNAFGMGIDKGDVTAVMHYEAPPTLEDYYQEAGRAGRNGKRAYAILLVNEADTLRLRENFEIQYPKIEELKSFYNVLMKFLQIPLGSGMDQTYPLSLRALAEHLPLSPKKIFYYLQQLSTLEVAKYSAHFFQPTQVHIVKDKRELFDLYDSYPNFENVIQALLRNYEGLFTDYVRIDEDKIGKKIGVSKEKVVLVLQQLETAKLIRLKLRSEQPSIQLKFDCIPKEYLELDELKYGRLKSVARIKMESMVTYLEATSCRQKQMMVYLDDPDPVKCGLCDICLGSEDTNLSADEVNLIIKEIRSITDFNSITVSDLINRFSLVKREKIKKVLTLLKNEEQISITDGHLKFIN